MRVEREFPATGLEESSFQSQPGFDAQSVKNDAGRAYKEHRESRTTADAVVRQIAQALKDEISTANAKNADNRGADLIRLVLRGPETGFLNKTGVDAVNSRDAAAKALENGLDDIENGLGNEIERFMFKKAATVRLQQAMREIDGHAMRESRAYNIAETQKGLDGAMNDGLLALDADPVGWRSPDMRNTPYGLSRRLIETKMQALAELHGIPVDVDGKMTDQYADLRCMALTAFHSSAIRNMIAKGLTAEAEDYFGSAMLAREISLPGSEDLHSKIRTAAIAAAGDNLAADIFGVWLLNTTAESESVPVEDMVLEAMKQAGDDDGIQIMAVAGIRERAASWISERKEIRARDVSGVWKMLDQKIPLKTIILTPEWAGLSAKDRLDIAMMSETETGNAVAEEAVKNQKGLSRTQVNEKAMYMRNGDLFLACSDPNVLRSLSRTQVEALRSKFGMEPMMQLLEKWDAIRDPSGFRDAAIEKDMFDEASRYLMLLPDVGDQGAYAEIGTFRFDLEQKLAREKSSRKHEMTDEEKHEFIERTLARMVLTQGF